MISPRVRLLILVVMLLVSIVVLAPVLGQSQPADSTCTALAQRALEEVGTSCADLGRNAACYGFNRVGATFFQEPVDDLFSKPSDRTGIETLASIQTSPLDETLQLWGIAVLRLQANIPNTLPGQNVVFILMGDAQIQNAVPEGQAVPPSDVIVEVIAKTRARVRSLPNLRANVLQIAESGVRLQADAIDPTGEWLRVVDDGVPGWINREVVSEADLSALPVYTEEARAPMQSFYLTTGLGSPQCNDAPSMLVVQGPKGVTIDLTVNEARIQIGSTIILRLLDQNTMEITVLDGQASVNNLIVPAGFKATAPISLPPGFGGSPPPEGTPEPGSTAEPTAEPTPEATPELTRLSFPVITGPWEGCQPLTPEDRQQLQPLVNLPTSILNYGVTIPGQTNAYCLPPGVLPPQPTPVPGLNNQPLVTSGEVNCAALRPTSPLDGSSFGDQVFYWDPAPGATSYRVNLYRGDGSLAGSFETSGAATNLTINTAGAGGFFQFSWNVEALYNGQVACSSPMVNIPLAPPPPDPTEAPPTPVATPEETPGFDCPPYCVRQGE